MYLSMWSYPWDFVDCGMDSVLDELRKAGVNDVSVTTAYHAGRFLQIRSPKRKIYFPEDGVLYYPSDMKRFNGLRLKPKAGRFASEHPDFFHELSEKAQKRNMTVSGWTVCLHNTRLGYAYPDACVRNAFDDIVYFNQCPANDDVRAYMGALLEDISATLPLRSIQLESMNYMGFAHEYHHEKDGIGLTPYEDFLLSLCFCPSCMRKGKEAGIDTEEARKAVQRLLYVSLNQERAQAPNDAFLREGLDFFMNEASLFSYLRWRCEEVTSLMAEVRQKVRGCDLYFLSLLTNADSWLFGVDLAKISAHCDGLVICSYDCGSDRAERDVAATRADVRPGTKIMTGMRAFTPEYSGKAAFVNKVERVLTKSRDGFVFYNYGLIPQSRLDWIHQATEVAKD